jgi:hypothetical protein
MRLLIFQNSPTRTASTLLVNALYGLIPELYDKNVFFHTMSHAHAECTREGTIEPGSDVNYCKNCIPNNFDDYIENIIIIKTHNINIDHLYDLYSNNYKVVFICSERKTLNFCINPKYKSYNNVLTFDFDELNETANNTLVEIANHIYSKVKILLPEIELDKTKCHGRINLMNARYNEIRKMDFSYIDPYFHLHGSHCHRKTIIQVYTQKYSNTDNGETIISSNDNPHYNGTAKYHGLGDFLRSCLGLYNLSRIKEDFDVIVDFSLHPIHNYIESSNHPYSSLVKSNKDNINLVVGTDRVLKYINKTDEKIIIMFGWFDLEVYDTFLESAAADFMKKLLIPNHSMQNYINQKIAEIPYYNFNVIHYRLGDTQLFNNTIDDYELHHFLTKLEKNDVLITDSHNFKKFIKEKKWIDVFTFDTIISHLGKSNENIRDTLFEFFLILRAKKIKSYSVYNWNSGFAFALSFIYKIPIEAETNIYVYKLKKCSSEGCNYSRSASAFFGNYCCLACKKNKPTHGIWCKKNIYSST